MELEHVLHEAGHVVTGCARDAAEAVRLAEASPPDLALVDMNLADGATGADVARRLARAHGTAVVFLTANPEHAQADFAGFLGVISKPFEERTILETAAWAAALRDGRSDAAPPRRLRRAGRELSRD